MYQKASTSISQAKKIFLRKAYKLKILNLKINQLHITFLPREKN